MARPRHGLSVAVMPTVTPRRIAALLLIALTATGLLLIADDPRRVSVPPGAQAGHLDLEACEYDGLPAECGTLVVPENRRDPESRNIALPVTRVLARSDHPAEPILRLEGGPGKTNMRFPAAARFAERHDVVLVGYRGVDGSVRLDCPEVATAMGRPRDLLSSAVRTDMKAAYEDCAERLQHEGVDLAGYTVPQRADDLEAARRALGYGRVNLVSESAGTRYALVYAQRYPGAVHRSVMIGANPPGHFLWDGAVADEQIDRYGATRTLRDTEVPDQWMGLPVHAGNVRLGSFWGLMNNGEETAPLTAPMTIDAWESSARGDASGLWMQSLLANLVFGGSQVWGEVAAMARADRTAARRYFAHAGDTRNLARAASGFLFGEGDLLEAWPASADDDAYSRTRPIGTETLLVNGRMDLATPPHGARRLLEHLPNGRHVVLGWQGHTDDFWSDQPAASTRLITAFLQTGRVDRSLYREREIDLEPSVTPTIVAKGVAGTLVGLPLLAALALASVAGRVRRRGTLSPAGSVVARTLLAGVAGLAGWVAAIALTLVTSAPVALDDPTVAMVTVATGVALGAYYGWVDRRQARRARATGLAAALAGAVLGAGLGHEATDGLVAVFTAVAGAVAASNLALIVTDVLAGRRPVAQPV